MPLPWKKTRISRLVADHLQTQKRGGSLVVETGFPTSLVDLFVKNRDRLKKPSKKKRPHNPAHDLAIPPTLNNLKSSSSDFSSELEKSRRDADQIGGQPVVGDVDLQNSTVTGDTVMEGVGVGDANRVLVAVLKTFLLVILALGTKRFVVWITLSAFLLFFLEYVGKYFMGIYRPCLDSQNMLELLTQKLFRFIRFENVTLAGEISCIKGEKSVVSDCSGLIESCELNASSGEIMILQQPKSNLLPPVEQFLSVRENLNPVLSLKEVMERVEDNRFEILELKHQKSRKAKMAKMGSKFKKLVPKKFRSSKKKCLDSKCVSDGPIEEYRCHGQEQEKDAEQCELECKDQSLMLPTEKYGGDEEVVGASCSSSELLQEDSKTNVDAICISGELLRRDSKAIEVAQEVGRKTVGNLRYWFICLIVLAGLVGGRILALGLTLCWCLILKSGGIPRRYTKVPMYRTFVKFYT
ncbi:hypothetical protein LguiA_024893 [Lonicera macranthoides]